MILFISLFILCIVLYPIKYKKITFGHNGHYPYSENKYIGDNREAYLIIVLGILCLVCGLRDESVGVDTIAYVKTFESESVLNTILLNGEGKFEIGYKFIVQILHHITNNANFFVLICTVIAFIGFYYFIKENCKDNYQIALLIFMAFLYYTTFSALRQSIALAIGINSVTFLKRRNWIKASLLIIIGSLFHSTELVLFIMVPLSITKWNRKKIYTAIAIAFAVILLFPRIMNVVVKYFPVYDRYTTSDLMNYNGSFIGLFSIMTMALVAISIYKIAVNYHIYDDAYKTVIIISIIGSIFAISFDLVSHQFAMLGRVTRFFIPYIMVLSANIYSQMMYKKIFNWIVILLMGIFFVSKMNANVYEIIPYKTFIGW